MGNEDQMSMAGALQTAPCTAIGRVVVHGANERTRGRYTPNSHSKWSSIPVHYKLNVDIVFTKHAYTYDKL